MTSSCLGYSRGRNWLLALENKETISICWLVYAILRHINQSQHVCLCSEVKLLIFDKRSGPPPSCGFICDWTCRNRASPSHTKVLTNLFLGPISPVVSCHITLWSILYLFSLSHNPLPAPYISHCRVQSTSSFMHIGKLKIRISEYLPIKLHVSPRCLSTRHWHPCHLHTKIINAAGDNQRYQTLETLFTMR